MKRILNIILLITICLNLFSQLERKMYIKTILSPNYTSIANDFNDNIMSKGPKFGMQFQSEFGYNFVPSFGISTGINVHYFTSEFEVSAFESSFETTDIDDESYIRYINGSNISESQNYFLLGVPLTLNFQFAINSNLSIYLDLGANILFPIVSSYESVGTFSYTGYYESYNVTLFDIEEYGFYNDYNLNKSGDTELNSFIINGVSSIGLKVPISNSPIALRIGTRFMYGITSITKKDNNYIISEDINSYNSIMESSDKSTLISFGTEIGFIYRL